MKLVCEHGVRRAKQEARIKRVGNRDKQCKVQGQREQEVGILEKHPKMFYLNFFEGYVNILIIHVILLSCY